MAFFILSFICLMKVYVSIVIPGSQSSNFPLQNCSTDEMDILFVGTPTDAQYFINSGTIEIEYVTYKSQKDIMYGFLKHISSSPDTQRIPRVKYATVCDTFSDVNLNVDVSSWYFQTLDGTEKENSFESEFGNDCNSGKNTPYLTVYTIIESKITFTQRLFSEMSGVRKNVTNIAVIFLDGEDLSYEDSRKIPDIVQQHQKDIKIFTVVFRNKHDNEIIHLNDVLLLTSKDIRSDYAIVIMAICQQCRQEWFPFVHSYGTDYLSCYYAFYNGYDQLKVAQTMKKCGKEGSIVSSLETQEELDFIRTTSYEFIRKEFAPDTNVYTDLPKVSAEVSIGLRRNLTSTVKQFQWSLQEHALYRPLVVNNWMPGKPAGGRNIACGVWKFFFDHHKNGTYILIDDGWVDVDCNSGSSTLILCEKALPRRLNGQNLMRINPASNESLTNALSKGYFMKLGDNIVSVSTQVGNTHFITFVNGLERELFPLFDCGEDACSPRYISYALVCDYVEHCSNKRDESICMYATGDGKHTKQEVQYSCKGLSCDDGSCLPLEYVFDGQVDCICSLDHNEIIKFNDEDTNLHPGNIDAHFKKRNGCPVICNLNQCVSYSQLNDNHTDCTGPEGPLDETIGKLETVKTCSTKVGDIWAPSCVFIKDMYGGVMGCRDVSHLRNCTDFECPEGYVKCPQSYCIPIHYVLDGKVDCPTGEDEQNDNIVSCTGNFACWNSKVCVHPDLVCDGHAECPHQDDELDCKIICAGGFHCVTWRFTVLDYNKSVPLATLDFIDSRTRYMDLTGVDLSDMKFLNNSSRLDNLVNIKWSDCKIRDLQYLLLFLTPLIQTMDISYNLIEIFNYSASQFPALRNIRHLNLSYNKELVDLKDLELIYLEILDLSHTGLSYLDNSFFQLLPEIKHLNLSFTSISVLFNHLFPRNLNLRSLDLRGLTIDNFYEDLFNGLTIGQHLYTDDFETCCPLIRGVNISSFTCHAPEDAISSCFYLIGLDVQRALLWVVAVLAVLGNVTVIIYRVIWDRTVLRTGYGLFVTNLGISDFIMGVYLFIIAGADYYYRDVYVLYDKNWREGIVCRLAGFLATLSCETSTYFVFLITLDRFLIMKFPFGQIQFTYKSKIISLLLSWIISFLFALITLVFKFEIYSSNAMCLGLPLTTQRLSGWQYSFGVFIVHNLFMFLLIAYGQRAIFTAMRGNRIDNSTSSRGVQDILVAKQLVLVAMSTFLCWFPIGIMGLLSLGEHAISNDVYAWTTVVILPLNSAANPILYTIPAILDKWDKFKHGDNKLQSSTK